MCWCRKFDWLSYLLFLGGMEIRVFLNKCPLWFLVVNSYFYRHIWLKEIVVEVMVGPKLANLVTHLSINKEN